MQFMPNASARIATSRPIRPRPIIPMVLPIISWPVIRFQPPDAVILACSIRFLLSERISIKTCSETVVWLTPGQKPTGIFFFVA